MEQTILRGTNEKQEEEAQAAIDIWKYALGFTEMAVVKCAIDLGIADILEKNGGSMTLTQLSSSLECPPSYISRIMRLLVHRKIFKQNQSTQNTLSDSQTPLSRRLLSHGEKSMAAVILLESTPVMLASWLSLSKRVKGKSGSAFEDANGEDLWSYTADNRSHSKLLDDAMACMAKIAIPRVIEERPSLFDGVRTVVDVGGGNGATLSMFTRAFPWLCGINFDLPHVVSEAIPCERVEHVGGNMFDHVPEADVVLIKSVLHDWGDDESIQILKKCKEAIPKDKGKVIILEAVMEEENEDKLQNARLMLDMVMVAHTPNGKERSLKEWDHVLMKAGFSHFNVWPIDRAIESVIEAFP